MYSHGGCVQMKTKNKEAGSVQRQTEQMLSVNKTQAPASAQSQENQAEEESNSKQCRGWRGIWC